MYLKLIFSTEYKCTLSHTKNNKMLNAGEFNLMWKKFKNEMNIFYLFTLNTYAIKKP